MLDFFHDTVNPNYQILSLINSITQDQHHHIARGKSIYMKSLFIDFIMKNNMEQNRICDFQEIIETFNKIVDRYLPQKEETTSIKNLIPLICFHKYRINKPENKNEMHGGNATYNHLYKSKNKLKKKLFSLRSNQIKSLAKNIGIEISENNFFLNDSNIIKEILGNSEFREKALVEINKMKKTNTKKYNYVNTKKINVFELNIPNKWKFRSKFPKNFKEVQDERELLANKIWFIKREIRMKTYHNNKGKKISDPVLPQGFCVYDSILSDNQLKELHKIFSKLFNEYKQLGIIYSYQKKRGLTYLFTGDNNKKQYSIDTLKFMKTYNIKLYEMMYQIIKYLMKIYRVDDARILNNLQIIILKYEANDGIWLHIDNIARYSGGPIITISVGPDKIYYDLTPSLLTDNKSLKPIRVEIDNGDIVIMDGSARMEWAHGLPYKVPFDEIKYSILLKFDKFDEEKSGYNDILEVPVTLSKMIC